MNTKIYYTIFTQYPVFKLFQIYINIVKYCIVMKFISNMLFYIFFEIEFISNLYILIILSVIIYFKR